ncbi:MAG: DUF1156 domain-containing protein [Acidobacteria bacterium]|nr:DUF1156 domain-containing protein [Acidobacteriota bacterium]
MGEALRYPKRLIEVDLPIKRISAHARREKSIRHGHISTLHIWWARRPLASCRAVNCAALWPDPADDLCPETFRVVARREMRAWAASHISLLGEESYKRFNAYAKNPRRLDDLVELRRALLDFIADFANWDNSANQQFLATSRALTQTAHEALGGAPGTRPLVVDPFAGGGSIPLEALRVGADAFASDLNPVAVLLNKVVLEYVPKYGERLADEIRKWGEWIKREAEKELAEFYPKDADGATPIAYLWARTIHCEGPDCGAEVPLIRTLWLAKKPNRSAALQLMPRPKGQRVDFRIIIKQHGTWVDQDDPNTRIEAPTFDGTVKHGSATCPCCSYTTPVARVREQLKVRRGGANDARLFCVVTTRSNEQRRFYRLPDDADRRAVQRAALELEQRAKENTGPLRLVPDEIISLNEIRRISLPIYGMTTWGDLITRRNGLALTTLARLVNEVGRRMRNGTDASFVDAVQTCLAFAVSRLVFYVWLRRSLQGVHSEVLKSSHVPKAEEIVVDRPHELSNSTHDIGFYERELTKAFCEGRRVLRPDGIGTIVFASKTTASWEAILKAVVDAGWIVTGSWPIDTEMETRVAAQGQARLASSVHLVGRPRENQDGSSRIDEVGNWREVLAELPRRIHDWMPRLAEEGVVGADAIFACLGPALEVFSRYSRVERANGEPVLLREYLEQVWAAVSREALSMIFADPDTAGLDEDARLTAMWLWTIAAPSGDAVGQEENDIENEAEEEVQSSGGASGQGFTLEFDAARKIAQGLGARLEELTHVVNVKGDKARLLSVAERTNYLFGGSGGAPQAKKSSKKKPQRALFEELEEAAEQQGWGEVGTPKAGSTALDRVHQSLILFGAGRGEALKRFLVDEGVGRGAQFWKLAQALSALYPSGTDEKRWVDGVLARKKGLGF